MTERLRRLARAAPRFALLAWFLAAAAAAAQESFPYETYLPRTLSEIHAKTVLGADDLASIIGSRAGGAMPVYTVDTRAQKARVLVRFVGPKRPIGAEKKEYIKRYFISNTGLRQVQDRFRNEYLFQEAGTRYWLPVDNNLEPYMAKELNAGDPVDLYMVVAGSMLTGGRAELVVLVSEFQDRGPEGGP